MYPFFVVAEFINEAAHRRLTVELFERHTGAVAIFDRHTLGVRRG